MRLAIVGIASALIVPSHAAVSILDPGYSFSTYHTHSVPTSSVVSFDWDLGGAVHYQTVTASFNFGGLFRWDGLDQSTAVPGDSDFSGASVVRIGDNVYYNTSDFTDQKVFRYGPLSGPPGATNISTAPNWGLFGRNPGEMFLTGSVGFGTNEVYHVLLDGAGDFLSTPISLGLTTGSSGPIAFDASGNMFYAPGFADLNIYRYTAAEVAAAIADPLANPLPAAASRLWWNYSTNFPAVSGAAGLAFDASGNLLATLTDFSNPSYLVRADVDGLGGFDGFNAILSSTDRLGDVRFKDDSIYLANSDTILQVVPEPSTLGLVVLGGAVLAWMRRR